MKATMFIIVVFLSCTITSSFGGMAECRVDATPIEEGRTTAISCQFEDDVREMKATVNVHKIRPDKKQVLLASSIWPSNATQPTLTVYLKGYRVIQPVGRNLIVMIDSASLDQTGEYMCQHLPVEKGEGQKICTLNVTEKPSKTSCVVKSVPAGEDTTLTCNFNKNILRGYRIYVLQKRSFSDEDFAPVVDCAQDENFGQYPVCISTVEGYHVIPNQTTAQTLQVHFMNVSKTSEGSYICKVVSSSPPEKEDTCDFKLAVPDNADNTKGVIIGVATAAAVVVVALVVIAVVYKRKHHGRKTETQQAGNEVSSTEVQPSDPAENVCPSTALVPRAPSTKESDTSNSSTDKSESKQLVLYDPMAPTVQISMLSVKMEENDIC